MWELWTGSLPWGDCDSRQIISKVGFRGERLSIPSSCPQEIQDMMSRCFQDAASRPTFTALCEELERLFRSAQSESQQGRRIPESFVCPLSHEVMVDPVMCFDGYSYERSMITAHLRCSLISPVTGRELQNRILLPNNALRYAIEDWRAGVLEEGPVIQRIHDQHQQQVTLDSQFMCDLCSDLV